MCLTKRFFFIALQNITTPYSEQGNCHYSIFLFSLLPLSIKSIVRNPAPVGVQWEKYQWTRGRVNLRIKSSYLAVGWGENEQLCLILDKATGKLFTVGV